MKKCSKPWELITQITIKIIYILCFSKNFHIYWYHMVVGYQRDEEIIFSSCELRRAGQWPSYTQLFVNRIKIRISILSYSRILSTHLHLWIPVSKGATVCPLVPSDSIDEEFGQYIGQPCASREYRNTCFSM